MHFKIRMLVKEENIEQLTTIKSLATDMFIKLKQKKDWQLMSRYNSL